MVTIFSMTQANVNASLCQTPRDDRIWSKLGLGPKKRQQLIVGKLKRTPIN
jgi:hypothetical protein